MGGVGHILGGQAGKGVTFSTKSYTLMMGDTDMIYHDRDYFQRATTKRGQRLDLLLCPVFFADA